MTSSMWNTFQHPSSQGDYLQIHPSPIGKAALLLQNNNRRSTAGVFPSLEVLLVRHLAPVPTTYNIATQAVLMPSYGESCQSSPPADLHVDVTDPVSCKAQLSIAPLWWIWTLVSWRKVFVSHIAPSACTYKCDTQSHTFYILSAEWMSCLQFSFVSAHICIIYSTALYRWAGRPLLIRTAFVWTSNLCSFDQCTATRRQRQAQDKPYKLISFFS